MPDAVMIFAAGFGTRMGALTASTPKPLLKVAGAPLLDHALDICVEAEKRVVVNAHYHASQITEHLQNRANTAVLIEHPNILDTGGGLKNALPTLGPEPVFTLNSDAVWRGPNPLTLLDQAWQPDRMDALLLLVPIAQTVGYTRAGNFVITGDGRLTPGETGDVYTGAQILKTDLLAEMQEGAFSIWHIWQRMLDNRTAFGLHYPGQWADVGTPEGIEAAENMLGHNV